MKLYTVNLINEHQEEDKFDYLHFTRQPRECSTNNVDSLIMVDFFGKNISVNFTEASSNSKTNK